MQIVHSIKGPSLWLPFFFVIPISKLIFFDTWQINPEKAREEFRSASQGRSENEVNVLSSMGLGMLADQVSKFLLINAIYMRKMAIITLTITKFIRIATILINWRARTWLGKWLIKQGKKKFWIILLCYLFENFQIVCL